MQKTEYNTADRTVITGMRVTEDEKQKIVLAADQTHMTQSSFMRYAIFDVIERFDKQGKL